jgi:predicted enzyme related to lactoylglutathione lyase
MTSQIGRRYAQPVALHVALACGAVTVRRVVPNVFDDDTPATRAFYTEMFAFEVAMDLGWIVTLAAPGAPGVQVSVFERNAEDGRDPFVSIEVDDVDAAHERAVRLGHEVVYALRDEPWGVRRFMLRDPGGRVVNVLSHRTG